MRGQPCCGRNWQDATYRISDKAITKNGVNVATLSRGYKRKSRGYVLADDKSNVRQIGDEPYQIKNKFPNARVAVDENRCHGIEQLLKLENPTVEAIILDDAFQHRHVKAGLNILLTDFTGYYAMMPCSLPEDSANLQAVKPGTDGHRHQMSG